MNKVLKIIYFIPILLLMLAISSCSDENDESFVTEDGYTAIKIGQQIWMQTNLDLATFRNGDSIPMVLDSTGWQQFGITERPASCYADADTAYLKIYGRLYNMYAILDPRGLAPEGWRIPTEQDWNELSNFLGGDRLSGNKLKDPASWSDAEPGTSFKAIPGGGRDEVGKFREVGIISTWWSADGFGRALGPRPGLRNRWWYGNNSKPANGFYIRCIKE